MSDYERAQVRFKELCDTGATFHCPICKQDIPVAEIHHHFVLNGYKGCQNKALNIVPTNDDKLQPFEFVQRSVHDSIERMVIHSVLLGD